MLRSVSALAFLLIFLPAFGQESKTVFVDEADCGLKEVGYKGKPNAFTVAGKSDQMGPLSFCEVSPSRKEYEQQLGYCFLSGVSVSGSPDGSCGVRFFWVVTFTYLKRNTHSRT